MILIIEFEISEQERVREFVLEIQNGEFHLGFEVEDQPDLIDTAAFYRNGCFWTAKMEGELVGTIAIQVLDERNAVLRKLFVKKAYRGGGYRIAGLLLDTLIDFARKKQLTKLWLDTPSVATASHQFYERNGFVLFDKSDLPPNYSYPDKNSKIYTLAI
jgi:GNAT superfamily N-acetyltransferase